MAPKISRSAKGKNKIGETSEEPQETQPTVKSRRLTFNIRSRKLLPAKHGIVTDREGRFVYKVDFEPTVPQVPQPPEGGYTMDMMFAKLCSIQTSIDNNKRETNYEHNLMRRQMREIQRTQRRILAHYEGEEGSEEEDEQEDDDEEQMDESD